MKQFLEQAVQAVQQFEQGRHITIGKYDCCMDGYCPPRHSFRFMYKGVVFIFEKDWDASYLFINEWYVDMSDQCWATPFEDLDELQNWVLTHHNTPELYIM